MCFLMQCAPSMRYQLFFYSNALPIVILFQCPTNCSSIPIPYQLLFYSNALPIVILFQCPTNCYSIPMPYQLFFYSNALPIVLLFQCPTNCYSIPMPYQLFFYSNALPIVLLFQCPTNCSSIPMPYQLFFYSNALPIVIFQCPINCFCTKIICFLLYMYTVLLGLGKRFEYLNLHSFAAHSNLNFSFQSFAAMSTSMSTSSCALLQSKRVINNVGMFKKVEAVLLAAFVSFLNTQVMLIQVETATGTRLVLVIKQ